jgi:Cdc6-like AAA superfamily ATPase
MDIETALKNLDSPIQTFEEDLLQRQGFVESLCRIFEAAPPDESTVFALYGEWGSGKTSVKNLLKKSLADQGEKTPLPIEFNPWAFSGQDQVLEAFFTEIGKAIGRDTNGKEAAEGFKKLGAYLSFGAKTVKTIHVGMDLFGIPGSKLVGMVGEQLDGGSKSAKEYGEDIGTVSPTSLEQVQKELKTALTKLERPLLIILDDLDRLTPDQLLVIFQIVKLNANLPRVNYLLLMDVETIADGLKSKELGAEFIEKIVQFELTLPHVPANELKSILKQGFESVMGKYSPQIDWERWEEAWTNGCENLFTTLRRVKRFLHTLKFHVSLFASDNVLEVDPVDLFVVETIRKFAPGVHSEIPRVVRSVVCPEPVELGLWLLEHKNRKQEFGKEELNALTGLAPEDFRQEIRRLLENLFPQIGHGYSDEELENHWIRDTRICHRLFFDSYFRLAIPRQLPTQQEIAGLFACAGDQPNLRGALKKLYEKAGLRSLLVRIHCHRKKLKPESLSVFLGGLWWLDEHDAGAAGIERAWDTRQAVQSVSRLLIQEFCPEQTRVQTVLECLQGSGNIYALAYLVGQHIRELKENPHSLNVIFSNEALKTLHPACIVKLQKAADEGSLMENPDAGILLHLWAMLDSTKAMRDWVAKEIQDSSKLARFLSRTISKGISSGHRDTKVHYYITRKTLESYCTLDAEFEKRLASINPEKLPRWEKFAVEETVKRIAEKKAGNTEVDWSGK